MMTGDVVQIGVDDIGDIVKTLEKAFYDIPFENSAFQTKAFVIAAAQTPGRAYRSIGLAMISKIQAVKSLLIQRQRTQIDVEEKEEKIACEATSEFDRRRLRLDILEINDAKNFSDKLLNDALRELDCLYAEFLKFPAYTRAAFEAEEAGHFDAKLNRALTSNGAQESLLNMHQDLPNFDRTIALAGLERKKITAVY